MAKQKHFVIVNPVAGHGRANRLFPVVREELTRRGIVFDFHYTNEPMEAPEVAKMVIEHGFTAIVVMGGDGTINEVVNGMVEIGSELPLAVIPAGSGNDFARMNGIPLDPIAAIDLLLNGRSYPVDLGCVNDERYFVNGLGIGIDAQVARDVMHSKRAQGTRAYLGSAVREVLRFRAFPVTLAHEQWQHSASCISLGIANGKYVGGGFRMAPNARLDDGLLDICVIEDMSRLKRFVALPKARKGSHLALRQVTYHQVEAITVSSTATLVAHIDGEMYRLPGSAFTVSAKPKILRVVVPSSPKLELPMTGTDSSPIA